ncbi:MAG: hypothetical protein HY820_00410 [Acidobacteria bacterium]|nr:hypothetical protein [Acidobacteriota bacterium]
MRRVLEKAHPRGSLGRERERAVFVGVAAFILFYQLIIPPIVGMADNGDFEYVTKHFQLRPSDHADPDDFFANPDRFFRYVVQTWRFTAKPSTAQFMPTSEILLAAPTILVNHLLSKDGTYDIRLIGGTHALLLLAALYSLWPCLLALPGARRRLVCAILLLVAGDVMYVSYFNSFYTDTAALLFFVLSVAFFVRFMQATGNPTTNGVLILAFLLLFIVAKAQHSFSGIILATLVLLCRGQIAARFGNLRRVVIAGVAIAMLGATLGMLLWIPAKYKSYAVYNVLFGRLVDSGNGRDVLSELGLDPAWASLAGTNAFSANSGLQSPEFAAAFATRATHMKLLGYYVAHPSVAWEMFSEGLAQMARQRPAGFANFAKTEGRAPLQQARSFSSYSSLKVKLLSMHTSIRILHLVVPIACLMVGWVASRLSTGLAYGAACTWLIAFGEILLGSLADVEETTRHLFLANAMLDILWIAAVILLLAVLRRPGVTRRAEGA